MGQGQPARKQDTCFHNCAFVGYNENGKPRYCALRAPSADSHFRQDVKNSDKTYRFTMEGHSSRVYEFEAPIDAMSHATLCKLHGMDWREDHRVSERRSFYMENMMLEALSMLSELADTNHQQFEEMLKAGGDLSKEAKKELYLKYQDKGYEH